MAGGLQTLMGAMIECTSGAEPSFLVVDPAPVLVDGLPVAKVTDFVGGVNILPFGACDIIGICFPLTMPWITDDPLMLIDGIPTLTNVALSPCLIGAAADIAIGGAGIGTVVIIDPINATVLT